MTTKITTTPTPLAVVDTINSIIDDKLDKTGTAASATTLSGLTATVTELNYVDGVTSNIQTQLNGKLSTSGKAASATKADTATTAGNVTGTVAIANGGTGATDAETARANLGIDTIVINATIPDYSAGVKKTSGTQYTAETNGYIFAQTYQAAVNGWAYITVTINGTELPYKPQATDYGSAQMCFPIKQGDTYKITTNSELGLIYFFPMRA